MQIKVKESLSHFCDQWWIEMQTYLNGVYTFEKC